MRTRKVNLAICGKLLDVRTIRLLRLPGIQAGVFVLLMLLNFTFFTERSHAQTTSRLSGTVSDPSGAFITGAKVTLTRTGTHEARTTTTDSTGLYVFPELAPGTYD